MPVQWPGGSRPDMVRGISRRAHFGPAFNSKNRWCYESFFISGITKDSTGAVLENCVVKLFDSDTNAMMQTMTSDANGVYSFQVAPGKVFYVVAYKAGVPDVAGTTVNTLQGV